MRARMLTLLTILTLTLGLAVEPLAATASSGPTATAAAAKKKAKKKKAKKPTAKQCTPKAIKKLKGKKRKQRVAACKKRKKKAVRKPAPKAPAAAPAPQPAAPSAPAPRGSSSAPAKGGAFDYTKLNLSEPKYETTKDTLMLPMADGRSVYIEVVRPKAPGQYGVILESSPYHGTLYNREGWRILPQPTKKGSSEPQGLTNYFAPRGYAVVMMDLRGTGKSQGCLDHLGQKDASDLKKVVEWAASQSWSNGRVGMVGHSYVGSTPSVAAAQNPKGLVTIVNSAGLSSMYDHQYQHGVPWNLQWAGPVIGYQELAFFRAVPSQLEPLSQAAAGASAGDNFGKDPQEAACGMQQNALLTGESMLSGMYVTYHQERDHSAGVKNWNGRIWTVHGVNDNAARIASLHWMLQRGTRQGDKVWFGQWDHGSGCCPTRRGLQWTAALHAWFDETLLGRKVDTGPDVELFMNDAADDAGAIDKQGETLQAKKWPIPGTKSLTLHATPDKNLVEGGSPEGVSSFAADPRGYNNRYQTNSADFVTPPLGQDMLIAGVPKLDLAWAQTVERLHAVATLIDVSPNGTLRRISTCAMNPELRAGLNTIAAVIPKQRYLLNPPCFVMAHHLRKGHRLMLKVASSDKDHVPTFAVDPQVQVFSGKEGTKVALPVVTDKSDLVKDTVSLKSQAFAGSGA